MKIKFNKYFGVILASLAISCEADRAMPEQNNTFTLEQAKHFHMEHATDLRLPGMDGGSVKSSIDYNEILVPQWDKATYHEAQFPSKLARTYEVPLNTGSIVGGVLLKENATEHDVVTMKSSLIIQEFSQGEKTSNRQMVVTVLGKVSDNNNQTEAFSYMGSHKDFTGFMVVSTLEGEIVNIFQYLCGQRSVVYVRKTDDAPINAPLSGFSFLKVQGTKSSYGNSEPGICQECGKSGLVYVEYGMCENCIYAWEEELGEIIVTPRCPYCGQPEKECCCILCGRCGKPEDMCQCTTEDNPSVGCEYCGSIVCNGECRESGGDGGNTGNDAPIKPQLQTLTLTNNVTINNSINIALHSTHSRMIQAITNINRAGLSLVFNIGNTDGRLAISMWNRDTGCVTIILSANFANLSQSMQSAIVVHEMLHLNICALFSNNMQTVDPPVLDFINSWRNFYGGISDPNSFDRASHEYLAQHLLEDIKSMLEEVSPGLDSDKAKWGSLTETEEFSKLSNEEQQQIIQYLNEIENTNK
jgi:hypothetical protein